MLRGHQINDRISLELGRRVAAELRSRPEEVLKLARGNLLRWKQRNADAPGLVRCYDEWLAVLDLPVEEICEILTAETDESQRLRQNSPFPGVIPFDEVRAIKERIWAEARGPEAPPSPPRI